MSYQSKKDLSLTNKSLENISICSQPAAGAALAEKDKRNIKPLKKSWEQE
jgi:hypothetical protein